LEATYVQQLQTLRDERTQIEEQLTAIQQEHKRYKLKAMSALKAQEPVQKHNEEIQQLQQVTN